MYDRNLWALDDWKMSIQSTESQLLDAAVRGFTVHQVSKILTYMGFIVLGMNE